MLLAVATSRLFQLTELCLGRELRAECCCSPRYSSDERAILLLIAAKGDLGRVWSTKASSGGLQGALAWAATSVRLIAGDR